MVKQVPEGSTSSIRLSQGLAYSLPAMLANFLLYPIISILPAIYSRDFGLSLGVIASVMLGARIFDAISDPTIGYLSDRHRERSGSRKPWVIAGGIGLVISSYFLYVPPESVSVTYFALAFIAFYLSWTLFDVPHYSWGAEITSTATERTQLFSLRSSCLFAGILAYTAMPLLPVFNGQGFSPQTLKWSVLVSAVLMIPVLVLCTQFTPNGRTLIRSQQDTPKIVITAFIHNKPLLRFFLVSLLVTIAWGMFFAVSFIFADAYLGIGSQLPLVYTISMTLSLLTATVLYKAAAGFEKKTLLVVAVLLIALAMFAMTLLTPGDNALWLFTALVALSFMGNALIQVAAPSLLFDIVDYGTWKFGTDRMATTYSVSVFLSKAALAIGGSLALGLLQWYGFDYQASSHQASQVFGLHLATAIIPALFFISAGLLLLKMPINKHQHGVISQRLVQRTQRASSAKASSYHHRQLDGDMACTLQTSNH